MVAFSRRRLALRTAALAMGTPLLTARSVKAEGFRRIVRIGIVTPLGSALGQACSAFADAVAATPVLDSALQIEVHPNGALGSEVEMVKACASGALDLVFAASNVVAAQVPELGLLDAPFLFRDTAHAHATLDGPIGQEFVDPLRDKGLHLLAWGESGVRHVTAGKPVREPSDLRGLRIRVPQSEVMLEGFRALGAAPEMLPFTQLFDALRAGRFEAEENPVTIIIAAHFERVQRCLSMTGHVYTAAFFLASSDLLEDLDDAQRAALSACARIGAQASRDAAASGERAGVEQLRAAGMVVVEDVDRAALAMAAAPALDAAARRLGPDRAARIKSVQA